MLGAHGDLGDMVTELPDSVLGTWASEDGTKTLLIERVGGALRVTVSATSGKVHLRGAPAKFHAPKAADPKSARERLGYVQAETGTPGQGNTYDLFVARANTIATEGAFAWVAIDAKTKREDVRLFPEIGASYFEAVMGAYDDFVEEQTEAETHWVGELSTYVPVLDDR